MKKDACVAFCRINLTTASTSSTLPQVMPVHGHPTNRHPSTTTLNQRMYQFRELIPKRRVVLRTLHFSTFSLYLHFRSYLFLILSLKSYLILPHSFLISYTHFPHCFHTCFYLAFYMCFPHSVSIFTFLLFLYKPSRLCL
jgi:hypothetical protein